MTIQEVSNLESGIKIYQVNGTIISGFITLANHPKGLKYTYLINDNCVGNVTGFYLGRENDTYFTLSYDDAKEKMWENLKKQVESTNRIFMNGVKLFSFDLRLKLTE
jgi:hypothetical protein